MPLSSVPKQFMATNNSDLSSSPLRVSLYCSWQTGCLEEHMLTLAPDSTVQDALSYALAQASEDYSLGLTQVLQHWPKHLNQGWAMGIFGKKCTLDTLLQQGDRLELYRPLRVDPKVARRERFAKQGRAQSAGLFAARRSKHQQTPQSQ